MTGRREMWSAARKPAHVSASASAEGSLGKAVRKYPNREGAIR